MLPLSPSLLFFIVFPILPAFLADKPNLNPEESKKERKKEKQSFKGKAKLASSSYMEDGDEYRHWDELIPDALGLIFSNLSLQEILTVVPGFANHGAEQGHIAGKRSTLRNGLPELPVTLRVPRSDTSDSIVEQIAGRLSTITFLDVSYCTEISGCALEAIGKHCKLLVGLCRNMHPLDTEDMETQDDEAYAIATTMPKLKRLEMAYHLVSTEILLQILSNCTDL
ncbi:hypothetical protein NC653_014043 [Populus alba x Populus x berolinensis]|uniref:Uncharacterized protein n=1 Tax=Populus alba x Populus x berolinensis TaxID=444605 RepID=A0AAD6W3D4_9ROSI|nr:hypothetical protein NC653_014043 [Populus alba x Populus x berolinensis]